MHTYDQNFNSFFGKELDVIEIIREKKNKRLTTEEFIKKAIKIHGDKYDYSLVNYINSSTKVLIKCSEHNIEFSQTPINHLYGSIGCSVCNKNIKPRIRRERFIKKTNKKNMIIDSAGEKMIGYWLNQHSIEYEKQKTFNGCKNHRNLRYDFYLPNQNILIEYDGRQHFKPIECFGGEISFEKQQINDKVKTEYAIKNNYKLLRIPYSEYKNISEILINNIERT